MKIKYIFWGGASLLALLLLIAFLPVDSKLDAEAAAWGEAANDTAETTDNGYYYLMGIMAAAEEDPAVAGKAWLDEYLRAEREFLDGAAAEFIAPEYPPEKMLPRISGDYYCMLNEQGCFARLTGDPVTLRRELATHAVLAQRYRRLLDFAELKPLTQPTLYESIPPYRYLIDGHRVNQLTIILAQLSGKRAVSLEMLRHDMAQLRRHLASAHSLIGKMVMLSMFANDLNLLLYIAPADARQNVPALSAEERTLRPQLQREFGSIVNFHRHLAAHPESFETQAGPIGGWIMRNSLKSNMSVNDMFPYFQEIAELSALDAAAFNARAATGDLPEFEPGFSLRNVGGSFLNSKASPALIPYVARLHDVDCKIALANAALPLDATAWKEILEGRRELAVANPYRPEEKPYVEAGAVCFSGPFPDEQRHRCIRKTVDGEPRKN
ncbi:MAG TPA: hypothetical protein VFX02_04045 [Gammaproteobacteria bacterium]|nr:hypothetical protein [Gammaproteobacteria bacterium]